MVAEATPAKLDEPRPRELSRRQINVVFGTVLLGMSLAALDQTIVSTALPTIVGELGGAGHLSWVVTSYLLAETIAAVLAGKFGDLFGRKRVFQLSTAIFVIGSFLCGLAGDMTWLVLMRALQGIGAGGLMVTSSALIADVIPLRERGKYQGALGGVFGVTTVIGPLAGGLFTDHLSWRWAFYVNVPLALLVIVVAARTIPGVAKHGRPIIDYAGIVLIALGSAGLTLAASWGGTEYPWGSPTIIGLFVGSFVVLAGFVIVELRAKEPMLPIRLFSQRVFALSTALSFVVGFTMLGSLTFLPTYLQYVRGATATASGLQILPMVFGLLTTAIASGNVVSRTGRYRVFPIAGGLVMAAGLFLLSRLDENTPNWRVWLSMLVLGAGIGFCMQVLVIIVQNTVDYRDLGVATSGVTFFRTIGGAFGAAVFGSIFSNLLADPLGEALAADPGLDSTSVRTPEALHSLPAAQAAPIIDAYAAAIQSVFLYAIPVAVVAFLLALFLKEVPLRDFARVSAPDLGEGFGMPDAQDSDAELERAISRLFRRDGAAASPGVLAASGTGLDQADAWCVTQVHLRDRYAGGAELAAIARAHRLPTEVLRPAFDAAIRRGYLRSDDDHFVLTDRGQADFTKLAAAWKAWIAARLPEQGHRPGDEQLDAVLDRVAARLADEPQPGSERELASSGVGNRA